MFAELQINPFDVVQSDVPQEHDSKLALVAFVIRQVLNEEHLLIDAEQYKPSVDTLHVAVPHAHDSMFKDLPSSNVQAV